MALSRIGLRERAIPLYVCGARDPLTMNRPFDSVQRAPQSITFGNVRRECLGGRQSFRNRKVVQVTVTTTVVTRCSTSNPSVLTDLTIESLKRASMSVNNTKILFYFVRVLPLEKCCSARAGAEVAALPLQAPQPFATCGRGCSIAVCCAYALKAFGCWPTARSLLSI